ncbi:MAG: hypothetical protein WCB90_02190 [Methanosarcina sp.]
MFKSLSCAGRGLQSKGGRKNEVLKYGRGILWKTEEYIDVKNEEILKQHAHIELSSKLTKNMFMYALGFSVSDHTSYRDAEIQFSFINS